MQGCFTGFPFDVQLDLLHTIPALAEVEIMRPGYAIEYDYVPSWQLTSSLETRRIHGLFHAGQINGTSGYEEAAAQGARGDQCGIVCARRTAFGATPRPGLPGRAGG